MAAKTVAWFMFGSNPLALVIPSWYTDNQFDWLWHLASDDRNRRLYELFNTA